MCAQRHKLNCRQLFCVNNCKRTFFIRNLGARAEPNFICCGSGSSQKTNAKNSATLVIYM